MLHKRNCDICGHDRLRPYLKTKDFSVSHEEFLIDQCESCGFVFTNPIPDKNKIGDYYKAESYVSHTASKKGLINRIYHLVRWYTLRRKVGLISKLVAGRKLLDIGAGTGHFLNVAAKKGWVPQGLEPDSDARTVAKDLHGIELKDTSALHDLKDHSFDVITMWHVLEHVYDLNEDFSKISRLLSMDGVLVVAVPNRNSYDAKYYGEFWAAYDLPIHLYHFIKKDIVQLGEKYGLELIDTQPMLFDSFYVSMLSEKYKNGNLFKGALIGLKSNWLAKCDSYSSQIYILRRKTSF